MTTEFTPLAAAIGGGLIGLASAFMLVLYGKVTGISGLVKAIFTPLAHSARWQYSFVIGLLLAGVVVQIAAPEWLVGELDLPWWLIIVAGLLVGAGTSLANGCTSGHGVCGMSRFSARSWVATGVFMLVAVLTANLVG
ncbi:YeeE/YedE family protein [Pseudoalteromonas sp.]|uniref:YeeE/YedE family protein n=1 Tax=Pseudoalteromonas sp. TaxID=53249 RepID=UPI0035626CE7